jgi:hypothetical protein
MTHDPKENPLESDHWLEELMRLFAAEFPASECPAMDAIEGVGAERVEENRFVEDAA